MEAREDRRGIDLAPKPSSSYSMLTRRPIWQIDASTKRKRSVCSPTSILTPRNCDGFAAGWTVNPSVGYASISYPVKATRHVLRHFCHAEAPRLGACTVSDFFCVGVSGVRYNYFTAPPNPVWIQAPGNYIFVKQTSNSWILLYAGQCDDFSKRMPGHDRWSEAVRLGVTHVFSHTGSADENVRKTEERDMIQAYNPPMNVQHRTDGRSGFGGFRR